MDKKELSIGNFVTDEWYDTFKKFIEVESINNKGINLGIEDDGNFPELAQNWIEPDYKFEQLRGIPITSEVLEKFGFKHETKRYHRLGEFSYDKDNFLLEFRNSTLTNCDYIHELQNIYFLIMKTELIYQP